MKGRQVEKGREGILNHKRCATHHPNTSKKRQKCICLVIAPIGGWEDSEIRHTLRCRRLAKTQSDCKRLTAWVFNVTPGFTHIPQLFRWRIRGLQLQLVSINHAIKDQFFPCCLEGWIKNTLYAKALFHACDRNDLHEGIKHRLPASQKEPVKMLRAKLAPLAALWNQRRFQDDEWQASMRFAWLWCLKGVAGAALSTQINQLLRRGRCYWTGDCLEYDSRTARTALMMTSSIWVGSPECSHLCQQEDLAVVRSVSPLKTKTKGHREILSAWRYLHQLATKPNIVSVMSSLIFVQFLLLGLRVIDASTDTRTGCTGRTLSVLSHPTSALLLLLLL